MSSRSLEFPRLVKEFEALGSHIRPDFFPEFERRIRMLERECARHLNAILQEFRSARTYWMIIKAQQIQISERATDFFEQDAKNARQFGRASPRNIKRRRSQPHMAGA